MATVRQMNCCAIRELDDLTEGVDFKEVVKHIKRHSTIYGHYDEHYDWDSHKMKRGEWIPEEVILPAFIIFSQAGTEDSEVNDEYGAYGDEFAKYIEDKKLGTVQVAGPEKNPNSGNLVKVYLWAVDQEALMKIKAPKEE